VETLKLNARLRTEESEVLLDPTLPVGRYVVSLVLATDQGVSEPAKLTITVQRRIVRPTGLEPVVEPLRPPTVRPTVRPTPITPIRPVTPVTPVTGPTPVIRGAPEPRLRKPRAKKPAVKKPAAKKSVAKKSAAKRPRPKKEE
jgi:hypothetical protein